MLTPGLSGLQKTTDYRVVLPFYIYAALSFLIATILLLIHTTDIAHIHHFNRYTLAITHAMALGWGTMIILGASHQLLPVLIEGKLDSNLLAYLTFGFTATGIPVLISSFYLNHFGQFAIIGAILINIGIGFYIANVLLSSFKSKSRNIHAWYIITASLWLFSTTFYGLLLVWNFNQSILPGDSVRYLTIHAHLGLIGWFLLLVIGVGSRLIPMFLISKYTNNRALWSTFILINLSLLSFIVFRIINSNNMFYYISILLVFIGVVIFGGYIRKAYIVRIRRNVDYQMKTSLISVIQLLLPVLALVVTLALLPVEKYPNMALLYGFCILFGWITAIILGMTFKTLPFIVWNRVYHNKAHAGKTPAPKELFSEKIYNTMLIFYLAGFVSFIAGIIFFNQLILKAGASALVLTAVLYVLNTGKVLTHQPKKL